MHARKVTGKLLLEVVENIKQHCAKVFMKIQNHGINCIESMVFVEIRSF